MENIKNVLITSPINGDNLNDYVQTVETKIDYKTKDLNIVKQYLNLGLFFNDLKIKEYEISNITENENLSMNICEEIEFFADQTIFRIIAYIYKKKEKVKKVSDLQYIDYKIESNLVEILIDTIEPEIKSIIPLTDSYLNSFKKNIYTEIINRGGSGIKTESLNVVIERLKEITDVNTDPELYIIELSNTETTARFRNDNDIDKIIFDVPIADDVPDGKYKLSFTVEDRTGNKTTTEDEKREFILDKESPKIINPVDDIFENDLHKPITIKIIDNHSGINYSQCSAFIKTVNNQTINLDSIETGIIEKNVETTINLIGDKLLQQLGVGTHELHIKLKDIVLNDLNPVTDIDIRDTSLLPNDNIDIRITI